MTRLMTDNCRSCEISVRMNRILYRPSADSSADSSKDVERIFNELSCQMV